MKKYTDEDLLRLDARFATEGVHFHQRPMRAAMELLDTFSFGGAGDAQYDELMNDYRRLFPVENENETWPGMGTGFAASLDRVRRFVVPVVFGTCSITPWQVLGFTTLQDWWQWCRQDRDIAKASALSVADQFDISLGLGEVNVAPRTLELWRLAISNIADVANSLPTAFNVDTILQPICLAVELSFKAILLQAGLSEKELKTNYGHNLQRLFGEVVRLAPHRDDSKILSALHNLPPYVASRYSSQGLSRLDTVSLGLNSQFILASSIRRFSKRDFALEFERQFKGQKGL